MNFLKIAAFIIMLVFEAICWSVTGDYVARLFVDKNAHHEITSTCKCNNYIDNHIKESKDLSDAQKLYYLDRYADLTHFERDLFKDNVNKLALDISYEERVSLIAHYITFGGLIVSFIFILLVVIFLNQGSGGYLAPFFTWAVIGILMLIYSLTVGTKDRAEKRRQKRHENAVSITNRFKDFNRMA